MAAKLQLKVVPKSSRDRVLGWLGDRLKVAVAAPPEKGKANASVVALLAATLHLPVSGVRLVGGETSPLKTVEVDLTPDELAERLPPR
jgi:uncharacterized protein (TIGR00251 family)